jgi:hypothetical protein
MLVRFVVMERDEDSHQLTGVFHAAFRLRDRGILDRAEGSTFERLRLWFNEHLPVPDRFSRSRRSGAHHNAICWFKTDAVEHLGKMRELTELLARHGLIIRRLRTTRPGYVVYEDDFQVAAVPFRDTIA